MTIARHCDEIHASGSHGLEGDNNTAHAHSYLMDMTHEEEDPESTSKQHDTHDERHSDIATAACNSLVHHSVGTLFSYFPTTDWLIFLNVASQSHIGTHGD
jgi:hypothetical protein